LPSLKIYHIGLCATPGTNNGLQKAFRKVSEYREIHTGHKDLNDQIVRDVTDFMPDIVFMQIQTPNIILIETLRQIKEHCGKIVNFTGDVRSPLPYWYIETGKEIDLSLFVSQTDVEIARVRGINAEWLQIGFDPEIYNDKVAPAKVPEIVFTANNYDHFELSQYRKEVAYALNREFKNRFQLYGNGWTIPSLDCNASMEKQASIFRGAKICISVSNFNHSYYTSDRLLKSMGAGAFCLSHDFEGYDNLYTDKENIAVFNSIPDMIEKCYYYLEHEEERNRIAKNGYELTHKLYTWDSMINNLIKLGE
jgi:glycosyltransferase involved in cell wall biosynthesis